MRRGFCPEINCGHHPVLFRPVDKSVLCPECVNEIPVEKLRSPVNSESAEQEADWLQSKAAIMMKRGQFGAARAEMVNRMIDGFLGHFHVLQVRPTFEKYGVTSEGEVKRLSEMGRKEPIPAANISDYAFGIQPEHIDVVGYGIFQAVASYLSKTLQAVKKENNLPDGAYGLLPLSITDLSWMWNGAEAVSRACIGREMFANRLVVEAIKHLRGFSAEYKKRSTFFSAFWADIQSKKPEQEAEPKTHGDLDVAVFANVLGRTIMLLDAKPPFTVNVFVPFLFRPQDCVDSDGKKRSPLVLARTNRLGTHRAALVATAGPNGITQIRLSRKWFESVWGVKDKKDNDELLNKYLDFDKDGRCVVANGKYFNPTFLRSVVKAFEQADIRKGHVNPRLMTEWLCGYRRNASADAGTQVMQLSIMNQLWRCVQCETLIRSDDTKRICRTCKSDRYLRKQLVDGRVEYANGDHTETPAPNSWCFMKRKHFFNGVEYDNPRSEVQIAKDATSILKHRNDHFRECLGRFGVETLMDGCKKEQTKKPDDEEEENGEAFKDQTVAVAVDAILAMGNEMTKEFWKKCCEIQSAMSIQGETEALKEDLVDACAVQANVEQMVFEKLESTLAGIREAERVRIICSKPELFDLGGIYYHRAKRLHSKDKHFVLPLLGDVKFGFNGKGDSLEACTMNGHRRIKDSLEQICILALEPSSGCQQT